jgi:hypothetical protein
MPDPSNSYVTSATITSTGQIEITVKVNDFESGGHVEISGHATQSGGAFANYYAILPVPDPDPDGVKSVKATAVPVPPQRFRQSEEITVVVRVAKVWVTVLGGPDPGVIGATDPPVWPKVKQVVDLNGGAMYPEQPNNPTLGTIPPSPAAGA